MNSDAGPADRRAKGVRGGAGLLAAALAVAGCKSPFDADGVEGGGADAALRNAVVVEHRRHLTGLQDAEGRPIVIEVDRPRSDVEARLSDERLAELNEISGSAAYEGVDVEPGVDLAGMTAPRVVNLSRSEAVGLAVAGNLDLEVARVLPKIAAQQLEQAESDFDAVLFADLDWQKLDTPQPPGTVVGLANDTQSENFTLTTGVRRLLTTGGTVQLETSIARNEQEPSFFAVDSFYDADVLASITQPLLRGFGSDVTTAQVVLARNAEADAEAQLAQALNDLVLAVEEAYWNLDLSRRQVLIQQRLLDRTVAERDRLQERAEFDVSPVRITEANSRVELRRSDLIRVRAATRNASDNLKRLINSDDLPLADETLVLPRDAPVDSPIAFSLLDAVTTALERRPELERALLAIDDAEVRQRVADNAVLPRLDLTAAVGLNGIDEDEAGDAFDELTDADFIDFILGLSFERPIGNRGPEALAEQRRLERSQSLLAYRRDAQDVVLEVKDALRGVLTNYELVGATRAARWAAADSLRSINVQEDVGVALNVEFILDLKLNAQERLADAEFQEAQALANYMVSIAEMERAKGVLAERYGVEVGDGR
ncbi:MAG: TolC family protein [Planctomycetota bacterium]